MALNDTWALLECRWIMALNGTWALLECRWIMALNGTWALLGHGVKKGYVIQNQIMGFEGWQNLYLLCKLGIVRREKKGGYAELHIKATKKNKKIHIKAKNPLQISQGNFVLPFNMCVVILISFTFFSLSFDWSGSQGCCGRTTHSKWAPTSWRTLTWRWSFVTRIQCSPELWMGM